MNYNFINMVLNNPALQGTQELEMFKQMVANGDPRVGTVYYGMGQFMTPETVKKYSDAGYNDVNPYYDREKDITEREIKNTQEAKANDYNINVAQLKQQLEDEKRALDNQEGEKGTFGSTAREQRLRSFENQYNNKFQSLFNQAQSGLQSTALKGEEQLGAGIQTPEIQGITANLSQSTPAQTSVTQGFKYNPFNRGAGNIEASRATSAMTRGNSRLGSDFYNPFKYIR